ncbi:PREDICTED: active regulator of SIRT1-like [Branchiostoma belcheri]|uniref:Active regulator of SIRT1 n=1 Tax=Branchiostoma belcheri TaxID=7741 RepID=A0A6P4XE68_BRABE|nr:PREDICTED: active regulator of SIRT1-like [Branchiostoma belcheri]
MSASLVRKALELFKDDLIEDSKEGTKGKRKSQTPQNPRDLISTNRRGVKKQLKRLQNHRQRDHLTVKDKITVSAIEQYKRQQKEDHTAENLRFMRSFKTKVDRNLEEKILAHQRGRLAKNQPKKKRKTKETSVFSEDDFLKFEAEYVGGKK